jgi:predicted outer membrane lipoprotein
MKKVIKFGEEVEGYNIPVLNEREIRASAGILFLMLFISLMFILSKGNFVPIKYAITIFLTDLLIRVFINPAYSPFLILGRLIVRNQVPEYVGAKQKKFAWIIGIILASAMFVFFNIVNAYSIITGLTCLVCLIFLFCETAFGICIGCKFYSLIYKEKAEYCPGEVCDVKAKQDIQKTSLAQVLVVLAFIGYIVLLASLFNTHFKVPPHDLFGENSAAQTKG